MPNNRRTFLKTAATLAAGAMARAEEKFDKPLGVQIYTVRRQLPHDPDRIIGRIAQIGYTEVEGIQADMKRIWPILQKYHLSCPSVHFDTSLVYGKGRPANYTWDDAIRDAKSWGCEYMVIPYLDESERGDFAGFVDALNHAGEKVSEAGLHLCYHSHAFEYGGQPGHRPIDIFFERSNPKFVNLELDVFWVSVSGNDPVEMIKAHGDRIRLLHLKDKAKGTPVMAGEGVPRQSFKEVGNGVLNWPAILRAAEAANVQYYFVEQDETSGDPLASLAQSYRFLRSVTL